MDSVKEHTHPLVCQGKYRTDENNSDKMVSIG